MFWCFGIYRSMNNISHCCYLRKTPQDTTFQDACVYYFSVMQNRKYLIQDLAFRVFSQ